MKVLLDRIEELEQENKELLEQREDWNKQYHEIGKEISKVKQENKELSKALVNAANYIDKLKDDFAIHINSIDRKNEISATASIFRNQGLKK